MDGLVCSAWGGLYLDMVQVTISYTYLYISICTLVFDSRQWNLRQRFFDWNHCGGIFDVHVGGVVLTLTSIPEITMACQFSFPHG